MTDAAERAQLRVQAWVEHEHRRTARLPQVFTGESQQELSSSGSTQPPGEVLGFRPVVVQQDPRALVHRTLSAPGGGSRLA